MPLFGSKKHDERDTLSSSTHGNTGLGHNDHSGGLTGGTGHTGNHTGTGLTGNHAGTGHTGTHTGTGYAGETTGLTGGHHNDHGRAQGQGQGLGHTTGGPTSGLQQSNHHNNAGQHHGTGLGNTTGQGYPDQSGGGGYGNNHGTSIPPAEQLSTGSGRGHTGGHSTSGKIEHAIGSALGSESLKAKGAQKEREANALKVQSAEIQEAERLEHEASIRRERAVAHAGAHPSHGQAGAGTGY